jgi:hypothetical protein
MEAQTPTLEKLYITPSDDRYTIREALRRADDARVLLVLPWEVDTGWSHPLDYEVVFREVQRRELEAAWVVEDMGRRPLAREAGFPVFKTEADAETHLGQAGAFPPLRAPKEPREPRHPWWAEEPRRPELPLKRRQPRWLIALELGLLGVVLVVLAATALISWPSATIELVPQGTTHARIVPVSVDPTLEQVDLQRSVIPSRRIGAEFEGYVEVGTSGRSFSFSGRATGRVLFTNLLGQHYNVPAGTVVRTTSGSYPMRFETTAEVNVPPFGQAEAPIKALEEGPRGNVAAYQINLVEGVAGLAVRVTNPSAITGAESEVVAAVSEADRERAWELAAQQILAEAYNGLQAYLEPGEFLPHQALVIQAVPKQAFTHLVGEKADVLGLNLRLLVTGQAVKVLDAQAVAYRQLATQLPEGYRLIDARFEYGEAAEEDVGPGLFTFYVTTEGYGVAQIDAHALIEDITGSPIEEAEATLTQSLPLARPPEITLTPEWFPYMPFLPLRIEVEVTPGAWQ